MSQRNGTPEQSEEQPSGPHVLIVDDDPDIREVVELILHEDGFTTTTCASSKAALVILQSTSIHLLITDLRLPGGDGGTLIRHIAAAQQPRPGVILLTAMRAANVSGETVLLQNIGGRVLSKPFDVEVLLATARELTGWPGTGSS